MEKYVCKIANLDEMNIKWDYEIEHSDEDKDNWITWKKENINRFKNGSIIPYYGVLDGKIIAEATALIDPNILKNLSDLIDNKSAYLMAFRTIDEYQNKGYFSKLFKYMIEDLKSRGYKKVSLAVEPTEVRNKAIYTKFGFTNHIRDGKEAYPDGTVIAVEYYSMNI